MPKIRQTPTLLITFLLSLFLMPSVFAYCIGSPPDEFLFENETIGDCIVAISLNKEEYYVYTISGKDDILFSDYNGNIQTGENLENLVLSYYVMQYLNSNQENIRNNYQVIFYELENNVYSFGQAILEAFKFIEIQCAPMPYLEFISICVKPTDKLEIMKVGKKSIVDWSVAFNNYRTIGGDMMAVIDSQKISVATVNRFIEEEIAVSNFLDTAASISNNPALGDTQLINRDDFYHTLSLDAMKQERKIKDRITSLNSTEHEIYVQVTLKFGGVTDNIKTIAKYNGEYDTYNNRRQELLSMFNSIGVNDGTYTSDISELKQIKQSLISLDDEVLVTKEATLRDYNNKFILLKLLDRFIGFLKSLSIH